VVVVLAMTGYLMDHKGAVAFPTSGLAAA